MPAYMAGLKVPGIGNVNEELFYFVKYLFIFLEFNDDRVFEHILAWFVQDFRYIRIPTGFYNVLHFHSD